MARKSSESRNSVNPLPRLLRASAHDAAGMQMRAAGRTKWNDDDWNLAASTQERLVRAGYAMPEDTDDKMCYIRFQIAEQAERAGFFTLYSNMPDIYAAIENTIKSYSETAIAA